ncbi:MAG: chemotaxis protein CheW [Tepidisphaeraceae bacterium]
MALTGPQDSLPARAKSEGSAIRAFCTFRADDRLYGIDVTSLREVSTNITITPVPHAPPAVRGLANLRSQILLVLDLRPLLGLPPQACTADSRLIIFKSTVVEDAGILVDRGGDIVQAPLDRIEDATEAGPASREPDTPAASPLVVGICKLQNELMMIIDARRLADTIANLMR